ncbi:mitochondrial carrier protein, putative [Ichthyophthirius multifiliis]|uniref:Mitochondrial carrier protein, putative n=1 Tax=Ichthyophthirius multifiliis TaxID=5932 RepID=G0QJQ6_ICHMU|nr:mitochondrial carrier protein, putative [Ichthyophthirius multifiliis]EGR34554.1 mitochondrial carrier protein, putative [Ichthyophthirius multifiliis]|eukprot:XP_004039858.1 mitochondrial carrier protein, putative [Ichthyophthirius multifiliis]
MIVQTIKLEFNDYKNKRMLKDIAIQTIKNEGFKGLYSGVGISVIGSGPAFTLYMTSYEYNKTILNKYGILQNNDFLMYMIAGLFAEIISCIFWLPIDVIKERLQVQQNLGLYRYANAIDAIKQISKSEGIPGLYRAYGATICTFGPYSAFYFTFYEQLKSILCQNSKYPTFFESFSLAALAGAFASVITNPLEVSKIRMQVQRASNAFYKQDENKDIKFQKGNFGYKNIVHGIIQIIKKEGFASLFKEKLNSFKSQL